MALFYAPDIEQTLELPEQEATHSLRVLRLKASDPIEVTDGKGHLYEAIIQTNDKHGCKLKLVSKTTPKPLWQGHLHIAIAPTKQMERMEWFLEKATEIGIDEVTFLHTHYAERHQLKLERPERIVISAMKQSLKCRKPMLHALTPFTDFVQNHHTGRLFIAHCHDTHRIPLKECMQPGEDMTLLIGPEGDFSPTEVEEAVRLGYQPVTLSPSRLRTETAALAAIHTFQLFHQYNTTP